MESAEQVALEPRALYVGVRFRPGAATAFLHRPASELTGLDVPASELWRDSASLFDALAAADSTDTLRRVLLDALEARLARADDLDTAMVRWAGRVFDAPSGAAAPEYLSSRQGRRRFTAAVGLGPKRFARIARLQWVMRQRQLAPAMPWGQLAAAAGCHDQAHLIHEFVALTGATPAALAREPR
jgi:hypothetical protein